MKHIAMVINGIFEDENLLIIKSKGSQYTNRFEETITTEMLHNELERNNIKVEDCKIVVTSLDWKGNPKTEQF